jgi:hypothetical protein
MNFVRQYDDAIARDISRVERAGRAAANQDECCRFRSQNRVSGIVLPELAYEFATLWAALLPHSGFELCDLLSTLLQSCNL